MQQGALRLVTLLAAIVAILVGSTGIAQAATVTNADAIDDGQHIYVTFVKDAANDRLTCYATNFKTGSTGVQYILVSVTCQVDPVGSQGWQDIFTAQETHCSDPTQPYSCTSSGQKTVTWNPCSDGYGANPGYRAQADGYWIDDTGASHQFRDAGAISTPSLTVTKSDFC